MYKTQYTLWKHQSYQTDTCIKTQGKWDDVSEIHIKVMIIKSIESVLRWFIIRGSITNVYCKMCIRSHIYDVHEMWDHEILSSFADSFGWFLGGNFWSCGSSYVKKSNIFSIICKVFFSFLFLFIYLFIYLFTFTFNCYTAILL